MLLYVIQKEALYRYHNHHHHHPEGQYLRIGRLNLTSISEEYLPEPESAVNLNDKIQRYNTYFKTSFSTPVIRLLKLKKIGNFQPKTMLGG